MLGKISTTIHCLTLMLFLALPGYAFAHTHKKYGHKKHMLDSTVLSMYSHSAIVYDEETHAPLFAKNADMVMPIASITKLMTAIVVIDSGSSMDERLTITEEDISPLKRTKSRLINGMTMSRAELLNLALMSSENRAALVLARNYPGGLPMLVVAMNDKAQALGMENTQFVEPTGLSASNISTAQDLVKMVMAARDYTLIHQYTTATSHEVNGINGRVIQFHNTNPLTSSEAWDITLSKTGFTTAAGRCLVMRTTISNRPVIIVLLDARSKKLRIADAQRAKQWMERVKARTLPPIVHPPQEPALPEVTPPQELQHEEQPS